MERLCVLLALYTGDAGTLEEVYTGDLPAMLQVPGGLGWHSEKATKAPVHDDDVSLPPDEPAGDFMVHRRRRVGGRSGGNSRVHRRRHVITRLNPLLQFTLPDTRAPTPGSRSPTRLPTPTPTPRPTPYPTPVPPTPWPTPVPPTPRTASPTPMPPTPPPTPNYAQTRPGFGVPKKLMPLHKMGAETQNGVGLETSSDVTAHGYDDDGELKKSPIGVAPAALPVGAREAHIDDGERSRRHSKPLSLAAARQARRYFQAMGTAVYVQREFKPRDGFKTPFGAMAACVLGKAEAIGDMLLEVTFCSKYTGRMGHQNQCYARTAQDIVRDTRMCCEGFQALASDAAQACKKAVLQVVWPVSRYVVPMWKRCVATPSACALTLNAKLGRKVKDCHQRAWRDAKCRKTWEHSVGRAVDGAIRAARSLFARADASEAARDATRLMNFCPEDENSWNDARCIAHFYRDDNTFGSAAGDLHDQ